MNKMIFLNTGWMEHYQGLEDDSITGGGSFVQGYNESRDADSYPPCEIYNFHPYEGYMYGFVSIAGLIAGRIAACSIRIERLGDSRNDDFIDGVLVVWVAKSPSDGRVIVGWFKNATVYRDCQLPPEGSGRKREGRHEWGYRVSAKEEDCKLLPIEHRVLRLPKDGMGRCNVWYADKPENSAFRQEVREFIA